MRFLRNDILNGNKYYLFLCEKLKIRQNKNFSYNELQNRKRHHG